MSPWLLCSEWEHTCSICEAVLFCGSSLAHLGFIVLLFFCFFFLLAHETSCRLLPLSFFLDSNFHLCARLSSCFSWLLYGETDCHVSSFPRQLIESLHNVLGEFSFCMLSVWVLIELEPVTWMPALWRLPCLIVSVCYFCFITQLMFLFNVLLPDN